MSLSTICSVVSKRELSEYPADGIGDAGLDYYWNYGSAEETDQNCSKDRYGSPHSFPDRSSSTPVMLIRDMKAILKNTAFPSLRYHPLFLGGQRLCTNSP